VNTSMISMKFGLASCEFHISLVSQTIGDRIEKELT
jgi:hypothetical protein